MDCKRAYVKLSNERDTLKKMFVDSLFKHTFERMAWKQTAKSEFKRGKKTGRKQGVFLVLIPEIAFVLYWTLRH